MRFLPPVTAIVREMQGLRGGQTCPSVLVLLTYGSVRLGGYGGIRFEGHRPRRCKLDQVQTLVNNAPASFWLRITGLLRGAQRHVEADPQGERVLKLYGTLDARLGREVKARAAHFTTGEARPWAIDLAGVTAWDGNGLAALVHALDVSERGGIALRLINPSARLKLTFERAQLHHLFAIADGDVAA